MILAYVLVKMKTSDEEGLVEDMVNSMYVHDVHVLFGEWDVIVECELESSQEVAQFVIDELRSRDDVSLTSTLLVAK